jgi:hypothetical protein
VRAVRSVLWGPLAGGGEPRSQGGGQPRKVAAGVRHIPAAGAPPGGGRGWVAGVGSKLCTRIHAQAGYKKRCDALHGLSRVVGYARRAFRAPVSEGLGGPARWVGSGDREGVVGGLQGSDQNCAPGSMLRQGISRGVMLSMGSQGWWVTPGERFVRQ